MLHSKEVQVRHPGTQSPWRGQRQERFLLGNHKKIHSFQRNTIRITKKSVPLDPSSISKNQNTGIKGICNAPNWTLASFASKEQLRTSRAKGSIARSRKLDYRAARSTQCIWKLTPGLCQLEREIYTMISSVYWILIRTLLHNLAVSCA